MAGRCSRRLFRVVAVEQGQAERGETGVGALTAVRSDKLFLEIEYNGLTDDKMFVVVKCYKFEIYF